VLKTRPPNGPSETQENLSEGASLDRLDGYCRDYLGVNALRGHVSATIRKETARCLTARRLFELGIVFDTAKSLPPLGQLNGSGPVPNTCDRRTAVGDARIRRASCAPPLLPFLANRS